MRHHSKLMLALAMSVLALGPMACTSSSWCADCEQATAILGLNYQPVNTYTVGTAIPVNPPNPSGGTPRIYTVDSGILPPGLSLDPATGRITGTPTAAGVYTLTIRGANSANSASQTIQITVVPAQPLGLGYATPQVFPAASAIAMQNPVLAQATPGLATIYAITAGSLPAGLTLNADGTISGTPTAPGVFPFTVTATNGTRTATASATYTVTPAGSLGLTYATPKVFGAGLAITAQGAALLNPTPGVPTTYAVTTGALPAGLALSATNGDITGTPTAPGVFPFTVTATNGTRTAASSPAYRDSRGGTRAGLCDAPDLHLRHGHRHPGGHPLQSHARGGHDLCPDRGDLPSGPESGPGDWWHHRHPHHARCTPSRPRPPMAPGMLVPRPPTRWCRWAR